MEGFRKQSPEIPVVLGGTYACPGIAFYGTVQIREIMYVTQEEGRCIVAYQIPVPLFSVELHSYTADISFCVSGAAFTGYR